jgi:glutamate formiminotransferase / formiminotetrahydrofolate cyclodeaminase
MSPAPLVECIPNFSEGRRTDVIEGIVSAMAGVAGTEVLDVSSGRAANRTVVTMAGPPGAILESAFRGVAAATRTIDMRTQDGVHPRIGAADVVPLVPVQGVDMDDVVALAAQLSGRIGGELGVPVYRYGRAAAPGRPAGLAALRRGQLRGLRTRLDEGTLLPDDGPVRWSPDVARTGATAVGARGFLVALNATLTTAAVPLARSIARAIRSRGPAQRTPDGAVLRDSRGAPLRRAGPFPGVRAIGWGIEEYGRAQVSMNLVQPDALSVHALLTEIDRLARAGGAQVQGCELIGLIPAAVLARVGREASGPGSPLDAGMRALGLDHLRPCTVDDVVLERRLAAVGLLPA